MNLYDSIYKNILINRISHVELDPNGLCNSKCWYCPVKYKGNIKELMHDMPINDIEYIMKNLKDSVFAKNLKYFQVEGYSEVFLYKHFDSLISLIDKYDYKTVFYSNGTTLDYDIIDILYAYSNCFDFLNLNIPSFDREEWKLKTGMNDHQYNKLIHNLFKLHEKSDKIKVAINVHALEDNEYNRQFNNAILNTNEEISLNFIKMRLKYPKFIFVKVKSLIDRCGILTDYSVYKNNIHAKTEKDEVYQCNYNINSISKLYNMFNINSKGDVFLCCNDYDMKYTIGNLLEQPLDDIWKSEKHVNTIIEMFNNICHKCVYKSIRTKTNNSKLF
jgi:radical SAM protein with 4Fe4S-binding SPASM domain